MTDKELMFWIHSSVGVEKQVVADWLYEHNRCDESTVIRSLGLLEDDNPVETTCLNIARNHNLIKTPGVAKVASGYLHCLMLMQDRTVRSDGNNHYHQSDVPIFDSPVKDICAGEYFSCALKIDGTVDLWGRNDDYNQCGFAHHVTDVVQVACGQSHCLLLKKDGTVVAGGSNIFGEINTEKYKNIKYVAAGPNISILINNNDQLFVLGVEQRRRASWKQEHVVQIVMNKHNIFILKKDGTVDCHSRTSMQQNQFYTLKDLTNVIQIATLGRYLVALTIDGKFKAFGVNAPVDDGEHNKCLAIQFSVQEYACQMVTVKK